MELPVYHGTIDNIIGVVHEKDFYLGRLRKDTTLEDLVKPTLYTTGSTQISQLLRTLREQGNPIPVLILTAKSEVDDKVLGLDTGANDYLTKPFSVDELLARVRANLRRSSMASSESTEASTFDNGPLHIDYAAGYATKDGRELSLTPTEYKLLVLLAKNVDKVLTHTFITREIWGTSWDSDLASLRVFMRTLRKKIEADPSHPKMIQTHMGVGYRMQRL